LSGGDGHSIRQYSREFYWVDEDRERIVVGLKNDLITHDAGAEDRVWSHQNPEHGFADEVHEFHWISFRTEHSFSSLSALAETLCST
jgi:hypothetical protein